MSDNSYIESKPADKDKKSHHFLLMLFPKKIFGKKNRQLSTKYYKVYTQVEYNQNKKAIFCLYCQNLGAGLNFEEVFIKTGFADWKKFQEIYISTAKVYKIFFILSKHQYFLNTKKQVIYL